MLVFVIYMTFFSSNSMSIYPIKKIEIVLLFIKKITFFNKYLDFSYIFMKKKL